jgi:hypothetical protein
MAGPGRLMPIIPTTWEAELERSCFEASPGKKLARHYLSKNKLSGVVDTYNPRYTGGRSRRMGVQGWQNLRDSI